MRTGLHLMIRTIIDLQKLLLRTIAMIGLMPIPRAQKDF